MVIYLDTSAFLKLYIREDGSEVVQTIVTSQFDPLPLWDILRAEMLNAFRLKVFWNELDEGEADRLVELFDQRLARGQYFVMDVDRHQLLAGFRRLSEQTPGNGCRTMDILHVACALQLDPVHFVSFDARQRSLAAAAGLSIMPTD